MCKRNIIIVWIGITILSGMFLLGQKGWLTPCTSKSDCKAQQLCEKDLNCNGNGVCIAKPTACTEEWDPVCGCNGVTYSNTCFAHLAGVSVDYTGGCLCSNDSPCSGSADLFCQKEPGDCDGQGICEKRPDSCTLECNPVCGCDGVTYGNECYAHLEGKSIRALGACDTDVPCSSDDDCNVKENEFCRKPLGFCEEKCQGTCTDRDLYHECLTYYKPVCGCDGTIYGNDCNAWGAGVSVRAESACCTQNRDCNEGEETGRFCNKDYICDGTGYCEVVPTICTTEVDPVCGCDSQQYTNSCNAHAASVSVQYSGQCSAP